jgi:DNA polymerase-1
MKKLFLLDAFALIFRGYYALAKSPRVTSTGINTNAQFGFTNTLLDIIKKVKPTHLAVAFDTSAPTERHIDFAAYKANRQETPEDIIKAVPHIKQILQAMHIPILEVDGYEADDVIGHVAKDAERAGFEVYMVTPDKDYGQLVSEHVKIWRPPAFGNKEEIYGPAEVCAKWGIAQVSQVIDLLGLMGDAVDNIPGVPGVGEKTAAKLLAEYHTLEAVLQAAQDNKIPGKMGQKLVSHAQDAIMSKKLATIIVNIPFTYNLEASILEAPNEAALAEIFNLLEFKTLLKRILGDPSSSQKALPTSHGNLFGEAASPATPSGTQSSFDFDSPETVTAANNIDNTPHTYTLVETQAQRNDLIAMLMSQSEFCFDTETTGLDANSATIVGMSFSCNAHTGYYIPLLGSKAESEAILADFKPLFENNKQIKIGQNIKYDALILKWHGISLQAPLWDTMLAHYVIAPDGKHSMDMLSAQYLNYSPVSIESLIGKKGKGQGSMKDVPIEQIKEYAAEDADITYQLKQNLSPLVVQKEVLKVLDEIENPLIPVLTRMEHEGIKIDEIFLNEYSKELQKDAKLAEESVYKQAGVRFNLASPKQLGEVLFEKLQLDPKAKKTKTGQYATGEEVLLKLAAQHQIVDDILAFRELTKLQSTYVSALPALINTKTGRVHTSYAQAVAVTGRLSSNNPNLQNIPIRTARGREIRKAFIPKNEDYVLLSADYSQIELRIVAAISGDENMCAAFNQHIDIHTATAAKVFGIAAAEVTKEQRYKAKSVNFGIIYGQGAFGLADNLGISRTEAKEIIDNYKREFSGIQRYMDSTIAFAREHGYVQTLMGRKRWLSDINSQNFTVRAFAERNAINSPIQGSAADMIKMAMIKIDAALMAQGLQSKMLLQVHDELVFDVHKSEIEIMKKLVVENMQTAMPLSVPIIAEVGVGNNWLEAH